MECLLSEGVSVAPGEAMVQEVGLCLAPREPRPGWELSCRPSEGLVHWEVQCWKLRGTVGSDLPGGLGKLGAYLMAQILKHLPAIRETWVRSLH